MTPLLIERIHTCWLILGIGCWPLLAVMFRPQLIFAAMIIQTTTFMIWGLAGATNLCPLRALQYALRDGEPINYWWIAQPTITIILTIVFLEIFWHYMGGYIHGPLLSFLWEQK